MSLRDSIPIPDDAEHGWLVHSDGSRVIAERWHESRSDVPLVSSMHLGETYYQRTWAGFGWAWKSATDPKEKP